MAVNAAGTFFISESTKRILLNFRSSKSSKPNCFGFWGGKINADESIMGGLSREISEEVGFIPEYNRVIMIDEYLSEDKFFKYYSFCVLVPDEFIPRINHESSGYAWCSMGNYPKPLHPGARAILENESITKSLLRLLDSNNGSNFPTNNNN
jgi:ADP-ribose pyrophosphatase YjhB (NUDIX family)